MIALKLCFTLTFVTHLGVYAACAPGDPRCTRNPDRAESDKRFNTDWDDYCGDERKAGKPESEECAVSILFHLD